MKFSENKKKNVLILFSMIFIVCFIILVILAGVYNNSAILVSFPLVIVFIWRVFKPLRLIYGNEVVPETYKEMFLIDVLPFILSVLIMEIAVRTMFQHSPLEIIIQICLEKEKNYTGYRLH